MAAVVAYHLEPDLLPGGFLGVDVFFVLSGFLIGSLVLAEIVATGGVDLREFYVRRVRRLMPASLLLLSAIVVYAATTAGAAELSRLRSHVLWTLGWVANWGYISDGTAYVDVVAGASPLRHTWSLAIEEQFYAVFPLLVLLVASVARRRGATNVRRSVGWLAGCCLALSATVMLVITADGDRIDRAYFGTDTRLQAILAGVVIAAIFVGRPPTAGKAARTVRILAPAAAVALAALFVVGGERSIWMYRGGFTLVALVSAVLVSSVEAVSWLRIPLSWRPLVALGRISYGVYLWHWPITVVVDGRRTGLDGPALAVFRLALTLSAALASWWLVERPVRNGALGRRVGRIAPVLAVISVAAVGIGGIRATTTPGSDGRASTPAPSTTPGADPLRMILVGDSVAHTLAGAKVHEFPDFEEWNIADSPFDPERVTLGTMTRPGCSYLAGVNVFPTETGTVDSDLARFCGDWRRDIGESIDEFRPEFVVVLLAGDITDRRLYGELLTVGSEGWQPLLDDALDEFRRPTEEIGSVLVLLTPPPRTGRYVASGDEGGWREARFSAGLRSYVSRRPGVVLLDFAEVICPGGDCSHPAAGFEPSWRYDGWHFGDGGPAWVAQWLTGQLESMHHAG